MKMKPEDTIEDWLLLKQSLAVLTIVMVAFVLARPLHLEPATIAMFGAAVLMLLDNWTHYSEKAAKNIHQTFGDVEWITIFFFIGLFIVVHGVDVGGLLQLLANTGRRDRRQHGTCDTPFCGRRRSVSDRRQHSFVAR
jgi:Na+/H+ antiporter NhaD/arsenite permease-like protein